MLKMRTMKGIVTISNSLRWRTPSTWKNPAVMMTNRSSLQTTPGHLCGCTQQVLQNRHFSSGTDKGSSELLSYSANSSIAGPQVPHLNADVVKYIESVQESGNAAVLFSDSPPVLWTVEALCAIKDLPGMTWISTIICGTLLVRAVVGLPVAFAQNKAMARLEHLKPELQKLGEDLKRETAIAIKKFKWDEKTARRQFTKSYKKHWRNLVEHHNCHPMKSLALSLTQLPFWVCFSSALRNVVYAVPLPRTTEKAERWVQIHNESTPWVESLVMPDPFVFPAIFLVMNLLNIEFNRRQRLQTVPETRFQKIFPWVIRGGIVAIAFIATSVPSAVSMYWATSSSLAFAQNVALASPALKRYFKVPATKG